MDYSERANGFISILLNYYDLQTGSKTDDLQFNAKKEYNDSKTFQEKFDEDDKITKLALACDDEIYHICIETQKGKVLKWGEQYPDQVVEVGIKPDEYLMGFFGNINKALNGFGIYLAKEPIIVKKDIRDLNPNRKFPHSFNEKIEGSLNTVTNLTCEVKGGKIKTYSGNYDYYNWK